VVIITKSVSHPDEAAHRSAMWGISPLVGGGLGVLTTDVGDGDAGWMILK
jgi:hypothetical protein